MYQVGDYLVYGLEGVCRVEEIGSPKISGIRRDMLYYTLAPSSGGGVIYTPVDTGVHMRRPIDPEELNRLLSALPDMPSCGELPKEPRLIAASYQRILLSHDCGKALQLYKTLYSKQRILIGNRKTLNATDQRYLKQTEDLICSEIGFVLKMERYQALQLLRQRVTAAD